MKKNYNRKKGGWNTWICIKTTEKHIPLRKCNCEHQLCHGLFIPTIYGQRNCLFDIAENGPIISLPDQEFLDYH